MSKKINIQHLNEFTKIRSTKINLKAFCWNSQKINWRKNIQIYGRAFIFHMCISCGRTFLSIPIFFNLVTLTLTFDLLLKKLNLGNNFWTKRDRAFIFHMCISCGKTFMLGNDFLTSWPWPWLLTYFWKNLNLIITFELKNLGL